MLAGTGCGRLELPAKSRRRPRTVPHRGQDAWRPSREARQLALAIWIDRQIEAGMLRSDAGAAAGQPMGEVTNEALRPMQSPKLLRLA